ncbi:MAG TPA: hypothetical protein VK654_11085 [Nitrospirota bacterium]|nr:hypothetical protein [Nitrospirota bacterium]
MNIDSGLAVPKDRQAVVVHLDTGDSIEGDIFMESSGSGTSSHQKILRFLSEGARFFPVMTASSTVFLNRTAIRSVEVIIPTGPGTVFFPHLLMHTVPVTVDYKDNSTLSGQLMAEVPPGRGRLSDCINIPSSFLSIYTGGKMYYVNKDSVVKIREADKR